MKQFSLFDTPPTSQELHFIKECKIVAQKLGLRAVPQSEIDERVRLSEIEYNKLLKEVERKI